jgi:hypothetical protein
MIEDVCSPPRAPFELMAPIIASAIFRCGERIDAALKSEFDAEQGKLGGTLTPTV